MSGPRLRRYAAGVLAAQFVVGLAGALTPRGEIFPFASWFLFSLVPDRVVSYDLLLLRDGAARPFSQAGGLVKSPHSVTAYQLIQQLGRAIEAGDPAEIRGRRRDVEALFAAPGLSYEVVRVSYRLAERWQGQPSPDSTILGSYHAGEDLK